MAKTPASGSMPGPAFDADESNFHGKLDCEARSEDFVKDVLHRLLGHVIADAGGEGADGILVRYGDLRRLIFTQLAQPPGRAGTLVEPSEKLKVDLRDLLPELVQLALAVVHEESVAPRSGLASSCDAPRDGSHSIWMKTTVVSRDALDALRSKYAQMLAMRLAHATAKEDVTQRRIRMAELSLRFPGALREMDDLELAEIRRRVAALDRVLCDKGRLQPWMEATALFHALARGALCAKRWLARRKRVDPEVERAYAAALPTFPFPDDARRWTLDLARIASPPRGRVTDVVFARVARELATTERAARLLVFGLPRRERETRNAGRR
jgi:hypothetical protein